jgi:hypothetical protein
MQTGPDDGGTSKKDIIDKAIKSVPKGISDKDAKILKETKEGKR